MGEVRNVLNSNEKTLKHLCLGAYLKRDHSWDRAFESATIQNLTHLDLVDTRISHFVLARIAHAHNLQSLTLHGTFEEPNSASVVFGSDHIIDGRHTFLPHLEAFRFVLVGHEDDLPLFQNVAQFLRFRPKLRRLDLGNCPWDLVQAILPDQLSLKVLRVRIANLNDSAVKNLLDFVPQLVTSLHLSTSISDRPMVRATFRYPLIFACVLIYYPGGVRISVQSIFNAVYASLAQYSLSSSTDERDVGQGVPSPK